MLVPVIVVVMIIVFEMRRVPVQQNVPVVIKPIKHPEPHHRAEARSQRLVRRARVVQRHALVRHPVAVIARCARV